MAKHSLWPALLLAMSLGITACSTTEEPAPGEMGGGGDIVGQAPGSATGAQPGGASASATGAGRGLSAEELLEEPGGALSDRIVYFDFDSSQIPSEYNELLRNHGAFLAEHPDVGVTVEGHTDERGSREYNLALGERRAQAVKQVLTLNGARGDQVETVSFGEEQPAAFGSDEQAWEQNRRAELVYDQ